MSMPLPSSGQADPLTPVFSSYRPDVPVPPPGPGVQPPFVAPPTDGSRKRRWIGLSIGGATLVVCLIGGVVGVGALVVSSEAARKDAATAVVTKYLTAWQRGDYRGAYKLVCDVVKEETSITNFTSELGNNMIDSYALQPAEIVNSDVLVPAALHFISGAARTERFSVVLGSGNESLVCGTG